VYTKEVSIKTFTRNLDSVEREDIENDLQRSFEILVRDIYAFYPLLIKYVDMHRAYWLKHPDTDSEQLYYSIAEVFSTWVKSKMFKREELNYVSSNNIDNMLLIMPSANMTTGQTESQVDTVATDLVTSLARMHIQQPADSQSRGNNNKKRRSGSGAKEKSKKFTSLIVACLKRLFQIGMNFFDGNEQELIQLAKQKFIDMKITIDAKSGAGSGSRGLTKKVSNKNDSVNSVLLTGSTDDNADLELNKDQEEIVCEFIRVYFKSQTYNESTKVADLSASEKSSYQKNKWQRMLYRRIGSKRMQNLSEDALVERILKISKVLFGLHMVEHPQTQKKGLYQAIY
jgi:ryanodine receptor 2